tara:strand:+ start:298 stop:1014 length:717 start_codon:yes stop_codon:yes gene_type:complete
MKSKFNLSSILSQLLLLMFVIIWITPTFGLFISSFRDKDLLATSGWWTSLITTEVNEIHRSKGKEFQIYENGHYIIKDNLFENIGEKRIISFGITSKKINEFKVGETAAFKDGSELIVYQDGNYEWKSEKEFKKKKGKRIFITANSPPNLSKKLNLTVSKTGYRIKTNSTMNAGAIKMIALIEFSYAKLFFLNLQKISRSKFDKRKYTKKNRIPIKTVDIKEKKFIFKFIKFIDKANK